MDTSTFPFRSNHMPGAVPFRLGSMMQPSGSKAWAWFSSLNTPPRASIISRTQR